MANNPLSTWPLSEYAWDTGLTPIGFRVPINEPLPAAATRAIATCAADGRVVLIAWVGPTYVVVEEIEPITEDDEKAEMEAIGVDWRARLAQTLEVVVSYEFDDCESDEVRKWLDDFAETATAIAVRDFDAPRRLKLFVDDGSRSTLPAAVVLFGVSGIDHESAIENRKAVCQWASSTFAAVLLSTPMTYVNIHCN